jgi:hypothetical protein
MPPTVVRGQTVKFWIDDSFKEYAVGIVTDTNGRTCQIAVQVPDNINYIIEYDVRHRNDPDRGINERPICWDFMDETLELKKLRFEVDDLKRWRVAAAKLIRLLARKAKVKMDDDVCDGDEEATETGEEQPSVVGPQPTELQEATA